MDMVAMMLLYKNKSNVKRKDERSLEKGDTPEKRTRWGYDYSSSTASFLLLTHVNEYERKNVT